jgi:predicted MFS family arabinose efflux permease
MGGGAAWAAAFAGMAALVGAMGIGRFLYTPVLPHMAEGLGLSATEAGLVASANFVGYLAGALAAALPAFRVGRRTWLLGALVVSAATTAAVALAGGLPSLIALRFLGGIASAFVLVFASALVLDRLAEAARPGLASLHFAGVGIGIAASALLVAADLGWRGDWLLGGVVAVLCLIATMLLIGREGAARGPASVGRAAGGGALRRLIVGYGLFGFGYVITATFLVALVRGSPALAPYETHAWLVVGLAAAPSVALWSALGRRLGLAAAFALACAVEAVGVALSVAGDSPWLVGVAGALLGGTFMAITSLGFTLARTLSPGGGRATLALMTAAFGLGQVIGPTFAGALRDWSGSYLAPSLGAALALAIAATLAVTCRAAERQAIP